MYALLQTNMNYLSEAKIERKQHYGIDILIHNRKQKTRSHPR